MLKWFFRIGGVVMLIGGVLGIIGYKRIFAVNTLHETSKVVTIPKGSSFDEVVEILDVANVLSSTSSFRQVAGLMHYTDNVKSGRYRIAPDLNNRSLVGLLRSGQQEPIRFTFSTARTIDDIAGLAAQKIEPDSLALRNAFLENEKLAELGFNPNTVLALIIPNTYESYWDISATEFVDKMKKEYDLFWSKSERRNKCRALGLTPQEVSALASIVEKESIQESEKPIIAGLYINRLKRGIRLQADPTVVFGVGDFSIRRVLNRHLAHDSPYNTYLYLGLPPGPICMPSISSIDAVLNPDIHDYIFMCAKPGYNGSHSFAKTNAQHARNAQIYHRWLNSEGIKG